MKYNSVVTCRHTTINSPASVPLNAKKIAVKKVSDVDVVMFGPELYFSMYKCYFLAHMCRFIWEWIYAKQIALGGGGGGGGFRGSQIQKFGESVKRLHRLAPNLVHVAGFVWEWAQAKYNSPHNTPGAFGRGGGLRCHKFKSLEKL